MVAYCFLTNQRVEERELAKKSVSRTREEFIAKERSVSDMKQRIVKDMQRDYNNKSSLAGHRSGSFG